MGAANVDAANVRRDRAAILALRQPMK